MQMIYLIRHAETLWNSQCRKQGLDDSPLTALGLAQAKAYGLAMKQEVEARSIDPSEILLAMSPLGRTRTTAKYVIDSIGLEPSNLSEEPRLIEFDYGQWSGLTNNDIENQYPGELEAREKNKWFYTVPGGESYAEVEAKVDHWLADLPANKIVIAVTHSVVSRVLRSRYLGMHRSDAEQLEHRQHLIFRLDPPQSDSIDVRPLMVKIPV